MGIALVDEEAPVSSSRTCVIAALTTVRRSGSRPSQASSAAPRERPVMATTLPRVCATNKGTTINKAFEMSVAARSCSSRPFLCTCSIERSVFLFGAGRRTPNNSQSLPRESMTSMGDFSRRIASIKSRPKAFALLPSEKLSTMNARSFSVKGAALSPSSKLFSAFDRKNASAHGTAYLLHVYVMACESCDNTSAVPLEHNNAVGYDARNIFFAASQDILSLSP